MLYYGQEVQIYANPRGRTEAAFKRFKKGEIVDYRIADIRRQYRGNSSYIESIVARYIKDGRRTNALYTFYPDEVIPKGLLDKLLGSYL